KTTWSDEMFGMYGITAEQFTGKGQEYLSFTHPDDRQMQADNINNAFARSAKAQAGEAKLEPDPKEFRIVRPDGTICAVIGDAVAILDSEGKPVRMVGILMDISERKTAEKQALDLALTKERAESLRDFLATISHDLKTPLSIISTSI